MNQQQLSMHALAKRSGIDHSTLYQFRREKRVPSHEQIMQISHALTLSPTKHAKLLSLWEIARVGKDVYFRRQTIQQILRNLPIMPDDTTLPYSLSAQQLPEHTALNSPASISQYLRQLLYYAASTHSTLYLIAQPTETRLINTLLSSFSYRDGNIYHIICLDSDIENHDSFYNLDCIPEILRLGMHYPNYSLHYYYENREAHFSPMTLFPNLVLLNDCAIQISGDFHSAIVLREQHQLVLLHDMFEGMLKHTSQLTRQFYIPHISQYLLERQFEKLLPPIKLDQELFLLKADIPLIDLLDQGIVKRNFDIDSCHTDYMTTYLDNRRSQYIESKTVLHYLLNAQRLRQFLETGHSCLLSRQFFRPILPADRLLIMQHLLQLMKANIIKLYLYSNNMFYIPDHWCILFGSDELFFEFIGNDRMYNAYMRELITISAFYDYYQSIIQHQDTISPEQSISYVEWLILEYQEKLCEH